MMRSQLVCEGVHKSKQVAEKRTKVEKRFSKTLLKTVIQIFTVHNGGWVVQTRFGHVRRTLLVSVTVVSDQRTIETKRNPTTACKEQKCNG